MDINTRIKMLRHIRDNAVAENNDYDFMMSLWKLDEAKQIKAEERKSRRKERKRLRDLRKGKATETKQMRLATVIKSVNSATKFVSIDLEKFERKQSAILEVGISTFTLYGDVKVNHYIVKENLRYKNKKFVPDHRDKFLFGLSVVSNIEDIKKKIEQAIDASDYAIGQAVAGDLSDLRKHWEMIIHIPTIDTQTMYKRYRSGDKRIKCGLVSICEHLGIDAQYLHNAGNDVKYSIEIFKRLYQAF